MKEWNTRCPLQSECGYKCKYHNHELDCGYYRANTRPGYQIEDQEERWLAELDAYDAEQTASAEAAAEGTRPVAADGDPAPPISGLMTNLPVSRLHPHPDNPRKDLGDLTELADSIRANGIFQNLTVIPSDENYEDFTVVIGHRRLAAAKLAGLTEVPCVITQMTVKEQMQTMLLENMQRSELTVYEQAQGFQMMLDLGSTVEEIAAKSGFSTTTVRRRVKMMELDQDILKQVSERQLSLTDFDRLAQIEDIAARNECLEKIGTADFNSRVNYKIRQQEVQKKIPLVMELLKAAKAIPENERYSRKYNTIESCYIYDWQEGTPLLPQKVSGQLFYYIETYSNRVIFFEKSKRAEPARRSTEEIESERRIAEAWNQLDEKAAVAYDLRSAFVKNLSYGKRNADLILRGALIYGVITANTYLGADGKAILELLNVKSGESCWAHEKALMAVTALRGTDENKIPALVYALFDDSAKESWSESHRKEFPKHGVSAKLKGLYDWLTALGYEMSEEEKTLLDGTHELFHQKEAAGEKILQDGKAGSQ